MSDIPDGADNRVALIAVAWSMVKTVGLPSGDDYQTSEDGLRIMVDAFNRTYKALWDQAPLEPKPS